MPSLSILIISIFDIFPLDAGIIFWLCLQLILFWYFIGGLSESLTENNLQKQQDSNPSNESPLAPR